VFCVAEGTLAHAAVPVAEVIRAVLMRGGQAFAVAHSRAAIEHSTS